MSSNFFESHSPVTLTAGATLIAILGSLLVTYVSISFIGMDEMDVYTVALVAILCPAIVAPPLIYFQCRTLREVARQKREISAAHERLKATTARVEELSELLPVCAWCHKVRDDQGYWERVEAFIERNTGTTITHGACPDCIDQELTKLTVRKV